MKHLINVNRNHAPGLAAREPPRHLDLATRQDFGAGRRMPGRQRRGGRWQGPPRWLNACLSPSCGARRANPGEKRHGAAWEREFGADHPWGRERKNYRRPGGTREAGGTSSLGCETAARCRGGGCGPKAAGPRRCAAPKPEVALQQQVPIRARRRGWDEDPDQGGMVEIELPRDQPSGCSCANWFAPVSRLAPVILYGFRG